MSRLTSFHRPACIVAALLVLSSTSVSPAKAASDDATPEDIQQAREELERARTDLLRATEVLAKKLGDTSTGGHRQIEVIRVHRRPIVGLLMANDSEKTDGALIAGVTPGGPAAKAGIRSGDRLLAVDGEPVRGEDAVAQAHELLADIEDGAVYELRIMTRAGDTKDVNVTAAVMDQTPPIAVHEFQSIVEPFSIGEGIHLEMDDLRNSLAVIQSSEIFTDPGSTFNVWQFGWRWNSLELASMNPDLGRYFSTDDGVLVLSFGSKDDNLRPGDVILAVNGISVNTPQETMRELAQTETGDVAQLEIMRDHGRHSVQVTAPDRQAFRFRRADRSED